MEIVRDKIALSALQEMSKKMFGGLVKAVVDIKKEIMVVDAPLHADQEYFLLDDQESQQEDLWGINIHPGKVGTDGFVEFDSMINIRPDQNNFSRGVDDQKVREKIKSIVNRMVIV
jgi:hypothetical protein